VATVFRSFDPLLEFGRLMRFGVVGVAATLVYAGATLLAVEVFGFSPVPASIFGQLVAMGVSYAGHSRFSFGVRTDHRAFGWRFLLIAVLTFTLNAVVTWLLTDVLRMSHRISVAIVTVLIPLVNYFCNRFWVFNAGLAPSPGVSKPIEPQRNRGET
jgi:putative flippase GtrA